MAYPRLRKLPWNDRSIERTKVFSVGTLSQSRSWHHPMLNNHRLLQDVISYGLAKHWWCWIPRTKRAPRRVLTRLCYEERILRTDRRSITPNRYGRGQTDSSTPEKDSPNKTGGYGRHARRHVTRWGYRRLRQTLVIPRRSKPVYSPSFTWQYVCSNSENLFRILYRLGNVTRV